MTAPKAANVLQGDPSRAADARLAVVIAKFNAPVVELLEQGCFAALEQAGIDIGRTTLVRVPGAFELPLVARELAVSGHYEAVIALGAVIRGETPHFDYVCDSAARGILEAGLDARVPVLFGVVTTDSAEHAFARADPERLDRGGDCALAALEMIALMRELGGNRDAGPEPGGAS